jgi:hypothetical protein
LSGAALTVCESRRQVEWLVRHDAVLKERTEFVAASPDAAWTFERRGLAFTRLEDYDEQRSQVAVERLLRDRIQPAVRAADATYTVAREAPSLH